MSTTKQWAKNASNRDLRRIKKDMARYPKRWTKVAKTAINAEIKQRGIKINPKKRAKANNPFEIPRGLF